MIKVQNFIKYISGQGEGYTFEQRLFISALITGILLGIAGTITNFALGFEIESILVPSVISLFLAICYYFIRFRGLFSMLSLPIIFLSYLSLGVVWMLNGGMDSSNEIIFIVVFILSLLMVQRKYKIYLLLFFMILKSGLYLIHLNYPWLVKPFPSENARWTDVFITSLYVSFIIYLVINFVHLNYLKEKEKVEAKHKELIQLNNELKNSNDTKDLFFAILSHDLKSPFNSIVGFSELLVNNAEKYDLEKIRNYSLKISNVANETYLMLENILNWSRLQKGEQNPNLSKYNLNSLVNEITTLFKELAKSKEIYLNNNVDQTISVYCDKEMTKTVLRNLLANAIKFTNPKGNISISAVVIDNLVEISISDSGIGISEEKLKNIFEPGILNSTPGTANEKGTGIGLHLCKVFIEKQGGTVGVTSEVGLGSRFYFTLAKLNSINIISN